MDPIAVALPIAAAALVVGAVAVFVWIVIRRSR
jgi:biopolymer transport protein ExbB/TolQ